MSETQQPEQHEEPRSIWRVAARIPWPAVLSVCLYLPGIILWAVYSLRCKASTFVFLSTIAPVSQETVDAVTNTVNTTLITLAAGGTFIFAMLLVLAIARSIQRAGVAPNASCPCARPTPSSYYLYRVFNMGFNIIVFFVNMAIMFLMMGAFLWLVVAFAANLSIKFGVRDAENSGIDPVRQFNLANQNYSTVVSYYEKQLQATPPCVVNTTWFRGLNTSIASILAPAPDANSGAANTLLCPQSCLNLGSFATLFKLSQNCICNQELLFSLQRHSLTVSTEAGVALGGSILIYLACCCLHAYLISEYVHAGYDYKAAKQHYAELAKQRRRRQQHKGGLNGVPPGSGGGVSGDLGSAGSGSGSGPQANGGLGHRGWSGDDDAAAGEDLEDEEMGGAGSRRSGAKGQHQHQQYVAAEEYTGDAGGAAAKFGDQQQQLGNSGSGSSSKMGKKQHGPGQAMPMQPGSSSEIYVAANAAAAAGRLDRTSEQNHRLSLERHSRQSSSGSAAAAAAAAGAWGSGHHSRQRSTSASGSSSSNGGGAAAAGAARLGGTSTAAAAAAGVIAGWSAAAGLAGSQGVTPAGVSPLSRASAIGSVGGTSSVEEQQHYVMGQSLQRPAAGAHCRSESRSSAGSIREIVLGAVPLDQTGHSSYGHNSLNSGHHGHGAAGAAVAAGADSSAAAASGNSSKGAPAAGEHPSSHHKPSSSSGSYESMIYHSPRNSDAGSSSSSIPAAAALAGAAAAAGVLDLSPAALSKRQQQQQQQQQQPSLSRGPSPGSSHADGTLGHQWGAAGTPDTIQECSDEVPSLTAGAAWGGTASPGDSSSSTAADTGAAGGAGGAASAYDALGSKASSGTGSLTGSGRRSCQSHRRLPAFDLTNTPTNFMLTVEGLEEQQELARSVANSRPCSPVAGRSAGPGAPAAAGAACVVAAAAAALRGTVQGDAEQQHTTAGGVEQQQQRHRPSMAVRRTINLPSQLQLPEQDDLQQQQQGLAGEQQQQQRMPFASPLLPPPEQQQLLLQQQQQQLALLLQQEQEQHQWQPHHHHRQWSTPSSSSVASAAAAAGISNGGGAAGYGDFQQHQRFNSTVSAADCAGAERLSGYALSSSSAQRDAFVLQNQPLASGGFMFGSNGSSGGSGAAGVGLGGMLLANGSPGGSGSMYNTPSGSPAPNSTPVGTPRPGSLGGLLPAGGPMGPSGFAAGPGSSCSGSGVPPLYGSAAYASSYGSASSVCGGGGGGLTPRGLGGLTGSSTPRGMGLASSSAASSSAAGSSSGYGAAAAAAGSSSPGLAANGGLSSSVGSNMGLGSLAGLGGLPPTIPETSAGYVSEGYDGSVGGMDVVPQQQGVGAAGAGVGGQMGYGAAGQMDVAMGSPLERRRSGYRSSMRKGLMAYDQYKHRQRYQEQVSTPLDPRTELSRRYRNRVPAV